MNVTEAKILFVLKVAADCASAEVRFALINELLDELALEVLAKRHRLEKPTTRRQEDLRAIRALTELLGTPPTKDAYDQERDRQRTIGVDNLPPSARIVEDFGNWHTALAAAHPPSVLLENVPKPPALPRKVRCYSDDRIIECLRCCAKETASVPTTRRYLSWRAQKFARRGELGTIDIPAVTTIVAHFDSWPKALKAAGLEDSEQARIDSAVYHEL